MSKITLELLSWLTETVGQPAVNELALTREIKEGSTVRDVLLSLAKTYPRFKKSVFDPKGGKLNGAVGIFYNGRQVELEEGLSTKMKDRDTLTIFPILAGG